MNILDTAITQTLQTLRAGGLILYPTDTIWGIGCDANNAEAINRIYQLKNRSDRKSLIILLADERDLLKYVSHLHPEVYDYLQKSARPTTVIYEGAINLPENLISEDGTIAIRIVREPFCKALIKRLRKPLISTSANISGQPSPEIFLQISKEIKEGVDYIVPYRQDDMEKKEASRIIKMLPDGDIKIIRE